MSLTQTSPKSHIAAGLGLAGAVLAVELLLVSLLYQHNFVFTCRAAAPDAFCAFAGRIVPRALGVLAALGLFAFARPDAMRELFSHAGRIAPALAINLAGFAAVLAPWAFVSDASPTGLIILAALLWSVGGVLVAAGLALMLAPAAAWRGLLIKHGAILAALVALGTALPEIADLLQPLWRIEWITNFTFEAVLVVLGSLGYELQTWSDDKIIGAGDFFVAVGPQCSGVEGFALLTIFLSIYFVLFRRDLRFPHVFLLIPIGLLLSAVFNVIRISVLLAIGLQGQPELAIGGFHSHAGWLAFTLLSIGLILISRAVPFFHKQAPVSAAPKAQLPFFSDPVVAQILPFAVFMATALLASTVSETPSVLYAWRAAAMAAGLAIFWPYLRQLPWRIDMLALGSGLAIGVAWIATGPEASGPPPFGELAGIAFTVWIIARVIGTVILVPVIEELMFRGYIQTRIEGQGPAWRAFVAIAIAAALFALLHDRWIAGGLAGIIFGLLYWRSRNLTDAILSHAAANATIAAWALATGAWHII
jgi:exosortase E/protease (VPEID-CTERM system)